MIPTRELVSRPGRVWKLLEEEGSIVVTKDGKPCSILLPTSDETLVEDYQAAVANRSRQALRRMRDRAAKRGWNDATISEIDDAIRQVRERRSSPRRKPTAGKRRRSATQVRKVR